MTESLHSSQQFPSQEPYEHQTDSGGISSSVPNSEYSNAEYRRNYWRQFWKQRWRYRRDWELEDQCSVTRLAGYCEFAPLFPQLNGLEDHFKFNESEIKELSQDEKDDMYEATMSLAQEWDEDHDERYEYVGDSDDDSDVDAPSNLYLYSDED